MACVDCWSTDFAVVDLFYIHLEVQLRPTPFQAAVMASVWTRLPFLVLLVGFWRWPIFLFHSLGLLGRVLTSLESVAGRADSLHCREALRLGFQQVVRVQIGQVVADILCLWQIGILTLTVSSLPELLEAFGIYVRGCRRAFDRLLRFQVLPRLRRQPRLNPRDEQRVFVGLDPDVLRHHVLPFLDGRSLALLQTSSRGCYRLGADERLWRNLCLSPSLERWREFLGPQPPPMDSPMLQRLRGSRRLGPEGSWKVGFAEWWRLRRGGEWIDFTDPDSVWEAGFRMTVTRVFLVGRWHRNVARNVYRAVRFIGRLIWRTWMTFWESRLIRWAAYGFVNALQYLVAVMTVWLTVEMEREVARVGQRLLRAQRRPQVVAVEG